MPNLHLKYVRDENDNFVIFSKTNHAVAHVDFKFVLNKIKSAGFMGINRISKRVICDGRSESLNIDSNPVDDSEFFTNFFKNKNMCYIHGGSSVVLASNLPVEDFEQFTLEMLTNVANLTDVVYV